LRNEFIVSHGSLRVLSVAALLIALPSIHAGLPWLLSRPGPHWGWSADGAPSLMNSAGLLLVASAAALLVWILATVLREVKLMPAEVVLSLKPARLIQTGPYTWTRHPIYLAEILLAGGVATYYGSPIVMGLIVSVAIVAACVVLPREERALERFFGAEYRDYRARVPFLTDFKSHPPVSGTTPE
jgi:protein-S-isoprenylcysteine O-methyltransferase Ste14